MPQIKSKDGLKSFLLTSRLLSPTDWNSVEGQLAGPANVESILQILERRQMLTPLQAGRILKGETEGLILGRYKLLYRNASGSFARVFRAASIDDNRMVALKLLRERWAEDPRTVASFAREARICQRFIHPYIVPIYDIGNEGRFHYFTMQFVEAGKIELDAPVQHYLPWFELADKSVNASEMGLSPSEVNNALPRVCGEF